jgi:hypothetical protein
VAVLYRDGRNWRLSNAWSSFGVIVRSRKPPRFVRDAMVGLR